MKTEARMMTEYKATETQLVMAFENAMMLMQDKYGYEVVTDAFFFGAENDKEVSTLVESGLEAIVSEGQFV